MGTVPVPSVPGRAADGGRLTGRACGLAQCAGASGYTTSGCRFGGDSGGFPTFRHRLSDTRWTLITDQAGLAPALPEDSDCNA